MKSSAGKVRVTLRDRSRADGGPWFEVMADMPGNPFGACMGRSYSRATALADFARRATIEFRPVSVGDLEVASVCDACHRPIPARDVAAFQADGGVGDPACCENCAELEVRP